MSTMTVMVLAAMFATIGSLVAGISSMANDKEVGRLNSAQWTVSRVAFQPLAVLFIVLALLSRPRNATLPRPGRMLGGCRRAGCHMSALAAGLVLVSVPLISAAAHAQTYPTKPIRIVVSGAPGGSPDIISRLMSPKLTEALGQAIVIDNRAGASGRIAVEVAAKAAPDGHTLLMVTSSQACVEVMTRNPQYEIVRDFSPVSLVGTVTSVLLVTPSVPATSVGELVALAKSRPGALKHGSSGPGSSSHLPAELFKIRTGTNILHVPYKASSQALVGLMAGEIDVLFNPITAAMSMIKSGKLRALGVTSLKRTPLALDLPTISETIPGFEFLLWQSLMAPAKTPPEIVSKLNVVVINVLNSPTVQKGMAAIGNEPRGTSRLELTAFVDDYMKQIREVVRAAGVKLED